jgi:hypothetical protein
LDTPSLANALMLTLGLMLGFPLIVLLHSLKLRGGRPFTVLLSGLLLAFILDLAWVAALAADGLP